MDEEITGYDAQLLSIAQQDERCQRIMAIEGIGPVTATAAVASIGDARIFRRGRELAAWLGLVPKQHSSGNKIHLQGISKRGDRYLRTLLIHGARSVVSRCGKKHDRRSRWVQEKYEIGGYNKASVALANKNARIIWALLAKGEIYQPSPVEGVLA